MQKSFLDLFSCKANLSEQQQHLFFFTPQCKLSGIDHLSFFQNVFVLRQRTYPYAGSTCQFLHIPQQYLHIHSASYIKFKEIQKPITHLLAHFWCILDTFLVHFWCTFPFFFYILLILQKSTKILRKIFWISKITKLVKLLAFETYWVPPSSCN